MRKRHYLVGSFSEYCVWSLCSKHPQSSTTCLVPSHAEPDEPLVEDGGLGPGHVDGLVFEQIFCDVECDLSLVLCGQSLPSEKQMAWGKFQNKIYWQTSPVQVRAELIQKVDSLVEPADIIMTFTTMMHNCSYPHLRA